MSPRQLLPVCDVLLGYHRMGWAVLHQDFLRRPVFIYLKGNFLRPGKPFCRPHFGQGIPFSRLKPPNHMGRFPGNPLVHNLSLLICNCQMVARKLFSCGQVRLGNDHLRFLVVAADSGNTRLLIQGKGHPAADPLFPIGIACDLRQEVGFSLYKKLTVRLVLHTADKPRAGSIRPNLPLCLIRFHLPSILFPHYFVAAVFVIGRVNGDIFVSGKLNGIAASQQTAPAALVPIASGQLPSPLIPQPDDKPAGFRLVQFLSAAGQFVEYGQMVGLQDWNDFAFGKFAVSNLHHRVKPHISAAVRSQGGGEGHAS